MNCEPNTPSRDPGPGEFRLFASVSGSTGLEVELTMSDVPKASAEGEPYVAAFVSVSFARSGADGIENFGSTATHDADGTWYLNESPTALAMMGPSGPPMEAPPYVHNGDRVSGAVPLDQTWPEGQTQTIQATFDLSFPDRVDCG